MNFKVLFFSATLAFSLPAFGQSLVIPPQDPDPGGNFQDVYSDVKICITKQNYIPLLVDYSINELMKNCFLWLQKTNINTFTNRLLFRLP